MLLADVLALQMILHHSRLYQNDEGPLQSLPWCQYYASDKLLTALARMFQTTLYHLLDDAHELVSLSMGRNFLFYCILSFSERPNDSLYGNHIILKMILFTSDSVGFWPKALITSPIRLTDIFPSPLLS